MTRALPVLASLIASLPCLALAGGTALDQAAVAHPAGQIALDATALPGAGSLLGARARLVQPWAGGTIVRLEQTLSGVPVEGRELVVVLGLDGEVRRTLGEPVPATWIDVRPTLTAAEALPAALSAVVPLWASNPLGTPRAALRAIVDREGSARLAWALDLRLASPPSTFRVLIDAHDGAILSTNRTSWDADGNVYPTNPATSEPERVELPNLTSPAWMSGTYAFVSSCDVWTEAGGDSIFGGGECEAVSSHVAPDANGDFLYTIDASSTDDPMAEVQMYFHLDKVSAWFDDALDFAHPEPIEGIVNFGYRNAFFGDADGDGRGEVAFGQWGQTDFAYDGDVVAHEFVHSVISRVVQAAFIGADEYGLEWAPGALNEGSADLFSMALYGDPNMGEYAGPGFGLFAPVRELEEDRRCPDDLYGESHRDGEIWGALGWNLIDDPLIGPEVAAAVVFGATLTWSSDVTWAEAGASVVAAADDLLDASALDAAQHAAILGHLDASGVVGCERVIALGDGAERTLLLVNGGLSGEFARVPASAQFSLEAPDSARDLRFRIRGWRSASPEMGWAVYVRRGGHIVHDLTPFLGFDFPTPAVYDFVVDGEGDGVDIVLNADSSPALEPGATYYFSIASTNLGGLQPFAFTNAEITVAGDGRLWDAPAGDDDDSAGGGSGCAGCGSSVAGAGGAPLALLSALALRRRGRAARRRTQR